MTAKEQFLTNQQRYQPLILPQRFSDEEMVRDWTLNRRDCQMVNKYRKQYRLGVAIQLCAMRLYGRFLNQLSDLSSRVVSYLSSQLDLPPALTVEVPEREATLLEHRNNILKYLGFRRFDVKVEADLDRWVEAQAHQGLLPDELFHRAERYLLLNRIVLPGPTTIERQIVRICNQVHAQLFEQVFEQMSPELREAIDDLLQTSGGNQRTYFNQLKEYPPAAKISSLKRYLERYDNLVATGINAFEEKLIDTTFLHYLYRLTKRYSAKDMKRFKDHKRYALMVCFLLESRKILLDHLVKMHDQYMTELCRQTKNSHDKKHKEFRKRQKKAIDAVLDTTDVLLEWPEEEPLYKQDLWQRIDQKHLLVSIDDLRIFKRLEERGYCDLLLTRYPSLRKYFADFIRLPFEVAKGSGHLIKAIQIVQQLDNGDLKKLPETTPIAFIPRELRRSLKDQGGSINRNVWEMGLALAMKDALRSGDLYLPQSKQHVSFWDLTLNEPNWDETRQTVYTELQQPPPHEVRAVISTQFHEVIDEGSDNRQLEPMAKMAQTELKADALEVVADAGYSNGEQLARCEEGGIVATVPANRAINNQGAFYQKEDFDYDASQDVYRCPIGEVLSYQTYNSRKKMRLYARSGCSACPQQGRCTKADKRWVSRHFYEDALNSSQARANASPELMRLRSAVVERPFAHLKQIMGLRRFQCWGMNGAKAEMGLGILAYNLNRMINELGVERLLQMI